MTEGAVRISTWVPRSSFIMLRDFMLGPSRKLVPPLVTTPIVPLTVAGAALVTTAAEDPETKISLPWL